MNPSRPHVIIFGNQVDTMIRFRGSLLTTLIAGGARVTTMTPAGTPEEMRRLCDLGVEVVLLRSLARSSINPLDDLKLLRELIARLRELRPTHMLSYFLKPSIYGTLAALVAGVPRRIALIEGLGFSFSPGDGIKRRIARTLVIQLLRAGLAAAAKVIVLNSDDRRFIETVALVPAAKIAQIDGIGIELDQFQADAPPIKPMTFTLAARLIREKGVVEFAEAARMVKKWAPDTIFVLLGGIDQGSNAIKHEDVERWVRQGLIEWPGHVDDVRPWLRRTSVFVLPSYYGEGLPRSIMEAMAMGRPVITSTSRGCRESVTHGVSGFVLAPQDPDALAVAMRRFVDRPELVGQMGAASKEEAGRRYDCRRQDALLRDIILGRADEAHEGMAVSEAPPRDPKMSRPV